MRVCVCEVVEHLLKRCHPANVLEAVMLSISLGHDLITEAILRSAKYEAVQAYVKVRPRSPPPALLLVCDSYQKIKHQVYIALGLCSGDVRNSFRLLNLSVVHCLCIQSGVW